MAESHEDDSSRAVKELSLLEIKELLISIQATVADIKGENRNLKKIEGLKDSMSQGTPRN